MQLFINDIMMNSILKCYPYFNKLLFLSKIQVILDLNKYYYEI